MVVGLGDTPLSRTEDVGDMVMLVPFSLLYPIPRHVSCEARKFYLTLTLVLFNPRSINNKTIVLQSYVTKPVRKGAILPVKDN